MPKKKVETDKIVSTKNQKAQTPPKKSKIAPVKLKITKQTKQKDTSGLSKNKQLFRIDEVAAYFNVTDRAIRLWISHGHLVKEKINGIARIPRQSIIDCRFGKKNK